MRHDRRLLLVACLTLALLLQGGRPGAAAGPADEEFRYRWRLRNFVGAVAGLFLPNEGEGSLTFTRLDNGNLRSELTITSPKSQRGEYFRYGAEIDPGRLQTLKAWSSYSWRGEAKSKTEEIARGGVLDVASGIYAIRQDPPKTSRRMEIWSDGKVYPVVVIPRGMERREVGDRKILARHYSIRGVDIRGQRRWKGKLDLWLANDPAASPVEISISRNLADVRLELLPPR
jgi:hypothetical protein